MHSTRFLLRPIVAVPARNEEERLPNLLSALARQTWLSASQRPLDVIVVLNNCEDNSAQVVGAAARHHSGLRLEVIDVRFPPPCAHVGSARTIDHASNWSAVALELRVPKLFRSVLVQQM